NGEGVRAEQSRGHGASPVRRRVDAPDVLADAVADPDRPRAVSDLPRPRAGLDRGHDLVRYRIGTADRSVELARRPDGSGAELDVPDARSDRDARDHLPLHRI